MPGSICIPVDRPPSPQGVSRWPFALCLAQHRQPNKAKRRLAAWPVEVINTRRNQREHNDGNHGSGVDEGIPRLAESAVGDGTRPGDLAAQLATVYGGAESPYHALGKSAGIALNAEIAAWRQSNGDWGTFPRGAVDTTHGTYGFWSDNENFAGDAVMLARFDAPGGDHADLYGGDHGGDPDELVARIVAFTGIAAR